VQTLNASNPMVWLIDNNRANYTFDAITALYNALEEDGAFAFRTLHVQSIG